MSAEVKERVEPYLELSWSCNTLGRDGKYDNKMVLEDPQEKNLQESFADERRG